MRVIVSAHCIGIERSASGPDAVKALGIRLEKWPALDLPQVDYGRTEGRHAVNVRIHQHLVIEPQDRIIENGRMQGDIQVRATESGPMPR